MRVRDPSSGLWTFSLHPAPSPEVPRLFFQNHFP